MDARKLDASWERAQARWKTVGRGWAAAKRGYHRVLRWLAIPIMVAFLLGTVWMVWKVITSPQTRHEVAAASWSRLKWYLAFLVVSWVIGKLWRKKPKPPVETDDGVLHQEGIQGDKQEAHKGRRNRGKHRRVQGR